jgi:hypothetical protein
MESLPPESESRDPPEGAPKHRHLPERLSDRLGELAPYLIGGALDSTVAEVAALTGNGHQQTLASARQALAPVQESLEAAGFYAYGMLDDRNRWTIAADDELGRVDVRLGADGFELELWASSPGLYADEDHDFRRRALERLARIRLPNIARGALAPYQSAVWDDIDRGVAVTIRLELPFSQREAIGRIARERLPELDELLGQIESQLSA